MCCGGNKNNDGSYSNIRTNNLNACSFQGNLSPASLAAKSPTVERDISRINQSVNQFSNQSINEGRARLTSTGKDNVPGVGRVHGRHFENQPSF